MQKDQNDLLVGSARINDRANVSRATGGGEEEVLHGICCVFFIGRAFGYGTFTEYDSQ